MIEIKNLGKRYGSIEAIRNIDFEVSEGKIFSLLGSNGAGKTTIIKILTGLLDPTEGSALIDGKRAGNNVEVKKSFGYMPEQPHLYDRLTGREFLEMTGSLKGLKSEVLKEKIDDFSRWLELEDRIDSEMGAYSKGMKQKILFANAVIHDPPNLILDEPTIGLDPRFTQYFKEKIKEFSQENKTILMSTHITPVASDVADEVGIIDKGDWLKAGSPTALMRSTGSDSLEESFVEVINDARSG